MFKISNESVYFVISSSESLDKHLSLLKDMGYKCKDVFNVTGFLSFLIVNPNGDMYTGMGDGGLQRMTESELINKHNLFKKQTSNKEFTIKVNSITEYQDIITGLEFLGYSNRIITRNYIEGTNIAVSIDDKWFYLTGESDNVISYENLKAKIFLSDPDNKKDYIYKTNDDITKALDKLNTALIDKKTVLFIHEVRDVFHITGYDLEYHDGSFYISLRGYTKENGSIRIFAKDYAKSVLKYVKIETKTLTGLFT